MQILINNAKVVGIFIAVSLISFPVLSILWNAAEGKWNMLLTFIMAIFFSMFTTALFFFAGRFLVKGTGILTHDAASLLTIIIIIIAAFKLFPDMAIFFIYPHLFLTFMFKKYIVGTIFAVVISLLALLAGIITKNRTWTP